MKKTIALCVAACLFGTVAHATEVPSPSPEDSRIKTVVFQPSNVVRINGMVGIVTHILLEPGEHYVDHAFGDSSAWWFADNDNHIFLKPKAEHADTNLVLITNRRIYNFELRYADMSVKGDKVFDLRFVYPETKSVANVQAIEKAKVEASFKVARPINAKYTMVGSRTIAPIHAWDNWQFTYFQFPGAVDMPEVFVVNADGTESIVNHNIIGKASDIVVVHKVAAQWVLRLGTSALSVYNDAYDPVGVSNESRTASPNVIRTLRGGDQP